MYRVTRVLCATFEIVKHVMLKESHAVVSKLMINFDRTYKSWNTVGELYNVFAFYCRVTKQRNKLISCKHSCWHRK